MRMYTAVWANLVIANVWAAAGEHYAFASFAIMAGICLILDYLLETK